MWFPCKFGIYSYVSSTISGLDHCTCLSYLFPGFVYLITAQGHFRTNHSPSFLRAKTWLIVLHRTQSIANIQAKRVNNYHISLSTTAKDTSRFLVTHSVQNYRTIDQITGMSKSPFWAPVTHVSVPIYILQALNMRTCLNQLTMSSVTYFISQANAGIRFCQD